MMKETFKNLTLGDIREICSRHQSLGRDCETCPVYKFCNYQMLTSYPSGWKLDYNEEEKGD